MYHLGQKIKKIRELKNLKQDFMAEQLGMSQPAYSKLEQRNIKIDLNKLEDIATIFDMKVEEIMSFDEAMMFQGNQSKQQHTDLVYKAIEELEFYKELSSKKDMLIR